MNARFADGISASLGRLLCVCISQVSERNLARSDGLPDTLSTDSGHLDRWRPVRFAVDPPSRINDSLRPDSSPFTHGREWSLGQNVIDGRVTRSRYGTSGSSVKGLGVDTPLSGIEEGEHPTLARDVGTRL